MTATVALVCVLLGAPPPTTQPSGDPELRRVFAVLAKAGLDDTREATLEGVRAELQRAQDLYIRGDPVASAVVLFELTQSPRYANFATLAEMDSAYYHLGVATSAHGADTTAWAAFAEVLGRGADRPYFTPALRRAVDLALASKRFTTGLSRLQAELQRADGSAITLSGVDLDEHDYLRARSLAERGDVDAALAAYDDVSPKSRFFTAAKYLQGVIWATRGDFARAQDAFCQVVGGPHRRAAAFYVDRRYFAVRDLARLGLGRIAHEQRRHDDAFYHDFEIPEDSPQLPEALFEAAWTMAEAGEYAMARSLVAELKDRFPSAPQATEARVLGALLELYDCDFRTAEVEFTRFIDDMAPVVDHIAAIAADPARTRALHDALRRRHAGARFSDTGAHELLLKMVDEDPEYSRLTREADVLRHEAELARSLANQVDRLRARRVATAPRVADDHAELDAIASVRALERGIAELERQIRQAEAAGAGDKLAPARAELVALQTRIRGLRARGEGLQVSSGRPGVRARTDNLAGVLAAERSRLVELRAGALRLAGELETQAATLAVARLHELKQRIDDLMGEARMGRIDAVLGAKKKLEIEVQDMAAGRFPAELFGKLQVNAMIGDAEEYWPYEGEYWSDEYEAGR